MSTPCSICKVAVTKKRSPGVQCNGRCKLFFHYECAKISDDDIEIIEKKNFDYKCKICRTGRQSLVFARRDSVSDLNTVNKIDDKNNEIDTEEKLDLKKMLTNQAELKQMLIKLTETVGLILTKVNLESEEVKQVVQDVSNQIVGLKANMDKVVTNSDIHKNEIRQHIDKMVNNTSTLSINTYADKLKSTVSNDNFMIVKPKKKDQKSMVTRDEIKNKIDPASIPINNVRSVSNGGIIIECQSKTAADALRLETVEKLGSEYDVSTPSGMNPRIKVIGLSEDLTSEQIVNYIRTQNDCINETAELKFIKLEESKNVNKKYRKYNCIVEMDGTTYSKVMEHGKLNIKWDRCYVVEAVQVTRCFNCSGFNHVADKCSRPKVCPKCADEHNINQCNSTVEKCINCINSNINLHLNLETNHAVWSRDCQVYQRKLSFKRQKINYRE